MLHVLAIFAAVWAVLSGAIHGQPSIGRSAPPISLEMVQNAPGVDPGSLNWEALAGKTVVLDFWATWCGPCVASIPHLNELADHFQENPDVVFLSVTYEDGDTIRAFRKHVPMRTWIGHDADSSMFDAFGVRSIPRTFVIQDGQVVWAGHPKRLSVGDIERAVRGETTPAVDSTMGPTVPVVGAATPTGRRSTSGPPRSRSFLPFRVTRTP
ncbi:MAG TPA: TlpA family protein disulfide reductase [Phycisphaerales bacterium]|nr:TlpA family protein disulfide reductase [Phycisphaerales bacterium]